MSLSPRSEKNSRFRRTRLRSVSVTLAVGFAVSAGCSESTKFTDGEEESICYGGTNATSNGGRPTQSVGGSSVSGASSAGGSSAAGVGGDDSGGAAGGGGLPSTNDAGAAGAANAGQAGGGGDSTSGGRSSGGGGGVAGRGGGSALGGGGMGVGGMGKGGAGPECGNRTQESGEECDDGNKKSGDGCSSSCQKACETCELGSTFSDMMYAVQGCYKDVSIMAAGPAAGVPKNELCTAFVDCARRTSCFVATDPSSTVPLNVINCFCKNTDLYECAISPDSPASVKEKFKAGDCKVEMEELMGTDLGTRIVTEANESPAAFLLYSDWAVCSNECKVAQGDCRRLLEFTVQAPMPPKAPPNGTLTLSVSVYDNFEQPVTTKWSVEGGGSFSEPNAATTVFTCPATAGSRQVSVEASVGSCVKKETITVECQP